PLTERQKAACKRTGLSPRAKSFEFRVGGPGSRLKTRSLSVASNGGVTVAQGFSGALESALVEWTNLRGYCGQFTTETGGSVPYPTEDDTSNEGEIVGENAETAFADDTFSSVTFGAYKFSSKGILVPFELLNDSEFDLEFFLGDQLGTRIGRIQGKRFTTGSGTGQPQGIVTASTLGVTSGTAGVILPSELVRLAHSVDPAHRKSPQAAYMMHDSTLAYLMSLTVGTDDKRPLIRASYADGTSAEQLRLNGYAVAVNQHMAQSNGAGGIPVTASKHVLFGDLSKHKIRDVGVVRVRRLDERYAEKDQVGFLGFMRSDSKCVNTAAIKHLLQA
ncbi:MAG TPA: phage major capsid protein, partial [Urbifossiella sp.]|nr:phage major capsid protein [Urbifossiella sp.]